MGYPPLPWPGSLGCSSGTPSTREVFVGGGGGGGSGGGDGGVGVGVGAVAGLLGVTDAASSLLFGVFSC